MEIQISPVRRNEKKGREKKQGQIGNNIKVTEGGNNILSTPQIYQTGKQNNIL